MVTAKVQVTVVSDVVETVRFREKDGSQGQEKEMRVIKGITPEGDFCIWKGYGTEPWYKMGTMRGLSVVAHAHGIDNDRSAGVAKLHVSHIDLEG